jgi:D-tyrosyl-tRNA(Tyr) deacylase
MRAVVQRVSAAQVTVAGQTVGEVQRGLLVLLGVANGDCERDAQYIADKVSGLRIFADDSGKMTLDVRQIAGGILVVSQFTLLGDCRRGRRPDFTAAAPPTEAQLLYTSVVDRLRALGQTVATGIFAADMQVQLTNDGPVTIWLDSRPTSEPPYSAEHRP